MHTNPVRVEDGVRGSSSEEMSLFDVLNVLLANRWVLVGLPLAFAIVVGAYSLTQPRTWTVAASFMPQSSETRSAGLAGVASQFGLALATGQGSESPAFYTELIHSRAILGALVDSSYTSVLDGRPVSGTLISLFNVEADNENARRQEAMRRLRSMISVDPARETNIVHVAVAALDPSLAVQIADRLFAAVNEFNLEKRQIQAAAERRFVEERLRDASSQLTDAEDQLQAFLEGNRRWEESSQLTLGYERLQRDVGRHQQLVIALSDAYERARIDEVRNLPLVTIVEHPELPAQPNGRGTVRRSMVALVAGLVIALAFAFGGAFMRTSTAAQRLDVELFQRLRQETVTELRHPLRSVARRVRAGRSE